jgi:hypothetical protein
MKDVGADAPRADCRRLKFGEWESARILAHNEGHPWSRFFLDNVDSPISRPFPVDYDRPYRPPKRTSHAQPRDADSDADGRGFSDFMRTTRSPPMFSRGQTVARPETALETKEHPNEQEVGPRRGAAAKYSFERITLPPASRVVKKCRGSKLQYRPQTSISYREGVARGEFQRLETEIPFSVGTSSLRRRTSSRQSGSMRSPPV